MQVLLIKEKDAINFFVSQVLQVKVESLQVVPYEGVIKPF